MFFQLVTKNFTVLPIYSTVGLHVRVGQTYLIFVLNIHFLGIKFQAVGAYIIVFDTNPWLSQFLRATLGYYMY